ncbi:MAG: DUF4012 domain-containing protein [Ilumatobacteraceae bacterium]
MPDRAARLPSIPPIAIAVLAGAAAVFAPCAPTANVAIDAVLVGVGTALVVLLASRAPWWAAVFACGVALAVALDPVLMAVAALGLAVALWAGSTRRGRPDAVALAAGIALNVLARSELGGYLGLSAIVAGTVVLVLVVAGLSAFPRRVRWLAYGGAALLGVLAVGAAGGLLYEVAKSRHSLGSGLNAAEQGVVKIERGDFAGAAGDFRQAADILDDAHQRVGGPLGLGAAAVPVLAQHRAAIVDMSGVGADGARTVADALDEIDLDTLRTDDGRFDLAALGALEEPLTDVRNALVALQQTTDESRSQWLVGRATYELDDFDESIDEHLPGLDEALRAIQMAPTMLGADTPRTYLVLFTTPSESRGLGGFIGNYGELRVDDGKLELSNFGRAQDLDAAAVAAGARVNGHEEFRARYGPFGFDEDGNGLVGSAAFRNLTMTPEFPWVGEIGSDIYTQTTGREVDGVIAMDPFVVAALLRYTGPIQLLTLDQQLDETNAVSFLLRDQYVLGAADNDQRADALAEAAGLTFDALLGGALPEPITLARDLGPLTGDRRLLLWSKYPEEQALLEEVGAAGEIPPLDGADGWAVTVTNGGGNKIDSFLDRAAGYTAVTDPATGVTTGTMRLRLTNGAPAEGLPRYIIGNLVGLPSGTSRLYVSFYSPLALTGATLDGRPVQLAASEEEGWQVYSGFVDIPPGGTVDYEVQLQGAVEHPDHVVTWEQPMNAPLGQL